MVGKEESGTGRLADPKQGRQSRKEGKKVNQQSSDKSHSRAI